MTPVADKSTPKFNLWTPTNEIVPTNTKEKEKTKESFNPPSEKP